MTIEEQIQEHKQSIKNWAAEVGRDFETGLNQRTYYLVYVCRSCGESTVKWKEVPKEGWYNEFELINLAHSPEYYKIQLQRPCSCNGDKTKIGIAELIEIRKWKEVP